MVKELGMPYMGSKRKLSSKIVDEILLRHPDCEYVYDLFGGGGAISFEFLQRKQIKKVVYNELNTGVVELLKDIKKNGITDKYYHWIDRKTFMINKDKDTWLGGFCKCIWSFGNDQRSYMYGKHVEENKKAGHEYCVKSTDLEGFENIDSEDIHTRRLYLKRQSKRLFKEQLDEQLDEQLKEYQNILKCKYTDKNILKFTAWLRSTGVKNKDINKATNSKSASHYTSINSQPAIPTLEMWNKFKHLIPDIVPTWVQDLFAEDYNGNLQDLETMENLQKAQRLENLENLERLTKLQSLRNLENLENLGRLERLEIENKSYDEVAITTPKSKTIIYLDPPYQDTQSYQHHICYEELSLFIKNNDCAVYVSSYDMDLPCILGMQHRSILSATASNEVVEKLFSNDMAINKSRRVRLFD